MLGGGLFFSFAVQPATPPATLRLQGTKQPPSEQDMDADWSKNRDGLQGLSGGTKQARQSNERAGNEGNERAGV